MIFRTLYTAAVGLWLLTSPLLSLSLASDSNVMAQVGVVPVTIYDVNRAQQRALPFNVSFHSGIPTESLEKIKAEALASLITQAYKVNYALDKKVIIDKKNIDEIVEQSKKRYKTEKEFKAALGKESLKDFRTSIERTLLALKAEELAIQKNINVSDADVRNYYDTNKHIYSRPKQFKASNILVKVNPASNAEERATLEKKIKELAVKAKKGEDFYNLAYYNSDDRTKYVGGDLGYFHEGQMLAEVESVLKKMKVGEISDPIKSMYGWHIIKLVEINEARQLDFDESKVKIREKLEKAAKDKLYDSWMADLKAKYPVKNFSE